MEKTKLGISVSLMAAAVYLLGLLSGYTVTILLVGYILLKEEDMWLKKQSVGALALMRGYSRHQVIVLYVAVILLVILVQAIQSIGTALSVKTDKRIAHK